MKNQQNGFTLVEFLIYIAIIAVILTSFIRFSISISDARSTAYVVQEVQVNGRMAVDIISQRIRASSGLNSAASTFGTDPGVLSLFMDDVSKNPTSIQLNEDDGILEIIEGASAPISITSDEVQITNLVFTELASGNGRENIRFQITVGYNNTSGDIVFTHSQDYRSAVSIRR
jgi:prepilin-type N-terminal cleavage/methylation domain-containing protein